MEAIADTTGVIAEATSRTISSSFVSVPAHHVRTRGTFDCLCGVREHTFYKDEDLLSEQSGPRLPGSQTQPTSFSESHGVV